MKSITKETLDELRLDLSIKAKNGIDFIVAATIVWSGIAVIWTLNYSSYNKSVLTFMIGGILLPLAFTFSKIFKTEWKTNNPLQPLGLWLNFAQLFYFPFLVFILIKYPDHFIMTYAIITGAHLFPYAWFYKEKVYAIVAGLTSIGTLFIELFISPDLKYLHGVMMTVMLSVLAVALHNSFKKRLA
jgi:hypothetical protein